jgi:hypothetical protein
MSRVLAALATALALTACSSSVPHAGDTALANVVCETIGQGISLQADVISILDAGQHVEVEAAFVDDSTVEQVTPGETWTCGPWSAVDGGCGRGDAGQPEQAQLDYRLDLMISAGTLPIPPRVRVAPVVFAAAPDDGDGASGTEVEADCTSP